MLTVILGSETWLSNSINNTEIMPDGMNATYCKDRGDGYGRLLFQNASLSTCSLSFDNCWHIRNDQ